MEEFYMLLTWVAENASKFHAWTMGKRSTAESGNPFCSAANTQPFLTIITQPFCGAAISQTLFSYILKVDGTQVSPLSADYPVQTATFFFNWLYSRNIFVQTLRITQPAAIVLYSRNFFVQKQVKVELRNL
jgi:hypothetical protein